MTLQYQMKADPRFEIRHIDGADTIVIRPYRPIFIIAFLTFWFCGWTVAGLATMQSLAAHAQPFILFWLGGWLCAWLYVLAILGWLFGGAETIVTAGGDLFVTYSVFGFHRRRIYRGSDIRDLTAIETSTGFLAWYRNQPSLPYISALKSGCLCFSYGARTIYAGVDLDKAEGRLIVARLAEHLPTTATLPA